MGCCQDKEVYVVCYWDCGEEGEWPPALPSSSSSGHRYSRSEGTATSGTAAVPSRKGREVQRDLAGIVPIAAPSSAAEGSVNGASPASASVAVAASSSCSVGSGALPPPAFPAAGAEGASSVTAAVGAAAAGAAEDIGEELAAPAAAPAQVPLLAEQLFITGNFAKWETNMPEAALTEDSLVDDGQVLRLRLCACLTSESLSFQVVSAEREWNWRLYPKGVKNIGFFHVSKQAILWADEPERIEAGEGDSTEGHGLNFHVMGQAGDVVTIWIEVPVQRTSTGSRVLRTNSGAASRSRARVWYTREDTGLQLTAGDNVDLNKYKWVKYTFGLG